MKSRGEVQYTDIDMWKKDVEDAHGKNLNYFTNGPFVEAVPRPRDVWLRGQFDTRTLKGHVFITTVRASATSAVKGES